LGSDRARGTAGTLFLDEIGEHRAAAAQVKLLRVLQERVRCSPVGAEPRPVRVDLRFVCRLQQVDLEDAVRKEGALRGRTSSTASAVYEILALPPLRDRGRRRRRCSSEHFLASGFTKETGAAPRVDSAPDALRGLHGAPTPGRATCASCATPIEHAFVTVEDGRIELVDLPESVRLGTSPGPRVDVPGGGDLAATDAFGLSPREQHERHQILHALEQCGWHRARTAEQLGFSRVTLWKKMRRYRIDEGIFRRG
jgi:transcriptional regulator of acetoin/glycerol metabolism